MSEHDPKSIMLNKVTCMCPGTIQINIREGPQIQNDVKGSCLHESVALYPRKGSTVHLGCGLGINGAGLDTSAQKVSLAVLEIEA